jgi:hypothetical protein
VREKERRESRELYVKSIKWVLTYNVLCMLILNNCNKIPPLEQAGRREKATAAAGGRRRREKFEIQFLNASSYMMEIKTKRSGEEKNIFPIKSGAWL